MLLWADVIMARYGAFTVLLCAAYVSAQVVFSSGAVAPSPPPVSSKNIGVSEKVLDGHVDDLMWAKDGETMFLLTSKKSLFRSPDGGKTWADQMSVFHSLQTSQSSQQQHHGNRGAVSGITTIVKSDHTLLFLSEGGLHFVTHDLGKSYSSIWHADRLAEFKLHPKKANMMLASTLTRRCYTEDSDGLCYKNLWLTEDSGANWKQLQSYVVQYDWCQSMRSWEGEYRDDCVFASIHREEARRGVHQTFGKWDNRVDFVVSKDKFLTHDVLVERGNRFLFTEKYIAVATVAETNKHVVLQLSSDGGKRFFPAELEYPMTQHSYTILDTNNDAVFLHVNHNADNTRWGNVYLSNSLGTNFSLTLPHNRRDERGKCDFERLQSMEGVYVANYYENAAAIDEYDRLIRGSMDNAEAELANNAHPSPEIRTVITFDRGATWEYLKPPKSDALGQPVKCHSALHPQNGDGKSHCSLHLHGVTDVFGPFYSSPSAVGLLMATGNIGSELTFHEGLVNTYFSRDGGHEWFEVAKGSHIYEFGDHGGLIVMANDETEVTDLWYSWNEGLTWENLKFASTPIMVDNIMTESKGASERFIVYGTRISNEPGSEGQRIGVVFSLDFTQLHMRTCEGEDAPGTEASDFEHWAPSATDKGDGCLLGRRVEYVRRKRDRQCYNPDDIEIKHFVSNCECTERDYECDRGYRRLRLDSGPCIRDFEVPIDASHLVPGYCQPGLRYQVSNGYRKVAGDSCVGGIQHEMTVMPCPGSQWHHHVSHGGWAILTVFLILTVSLGALTYCQMGVKNSHGGKNFKGGSPSRGLAMPSWVPAAVATPIVLVVNVLKHAAYIIARTAYHGYEIAAEYVKRRFRGSGEGRSYQGFNSVARYGQIGKEAQSLEEDVLVDEVDAKPTRDGEFGPDDGDMDRSLFDEPDLLGISAGPLNVPPKQSNVPVPALAPPRNGPTSKTD